MQHNSSVSTILQKAAIAFHTSPTARLEAEILLAHVLAIPRAKLYTDSNLLVEDTKQKKYMECVKKRLQGVPIPYITGVSEFWSLPIKVTEDVLIPRPESELLVETAIEISHSFNEVLKVLDVGTGSGAIAAAYAKENPSATTIASDISLAALTVAGENFKALGLNNVSLISGDWLNAVCKNSIDIIIANPPYISSSDVGFTSNSLFFEPPIALYADNDGMSAIDALTQAGSHCLKPGGFLLIEHGFAQKARVLKCFTLNNFMKVITRKDLAGLDRVTYGQKICIRG